MSEIGISFLFGAGAEGEGNYYIPQGFEYLRKSLFIKENSEDLHKIFTTISADGKEQEPEFNAYKYQSHTFGVTNAILKEFINRYIEINCEEEADKRNFYDNKKYRISYFSILNKNEREEIYKDTKFDENELKEIEEIKKTGKNNPKRKKILEKFKDLVLTGEISKEKIPEGGLLETIFSKGYSTKEIFYLGYAGLLDEYFHTIINPKKYGIQKFSNVFNYYWFCYFTIVESILKTASKDTANLEEIHNFFINHNEGKIEKEKIDDFLTKSTCNNKYLYYHIIYENIVEFTELLYNKLDFFKQNNSYYSLISDKLKYDKENDKTTSLKSILTTNYYKFSESISDKVNVTYLNGSLNLFEIPEKLEVVDLNKEEAIDYKSLFFPFIFGQSLVKPIVNKHQIKSFYDAIKGLDESDVLIIIGYGINEDDNHINALLHDFYKRVGTKIIVVGDTNITEEDIKKKIGHQSDKATNKIEIIDYKKENKENEETEKIIEKVFSKIEEYSKSL